MSARIGHSEWLDELARLCAPQVGQTDGFRSIREIKDETGRSILAIRDGLRQAQAQGRLEVRKRTDQSLSGASVKIPVYRVTPAQKENENDPRGLLGNTGEKRPANAVSGKSRKKRF